MTQTGRGLGGKDVVEMAFSGKNRITPRVLRYGMLACRTAYELSTDEKGKRFGVVVVYYHGRGLAQWARHRDSVFSSLEEAFNYLRGLSDYGREQMPRFDSDFTRENERRLVADNTREILELRAEESEVWNA